MCVLAFCLATAFCLPSLAQTIRGSTPPGYSDFQVAFGESTTLVATFFYEAGLEWDRGGVSWTVYPNGAGPKEGITCANGPSQNISRYTASSSCSVVTNSTVGIFTVTATVSGGPVLTYQIRNYANVTLVSGPLANGTPGVAYSGTIPGQFGSQPLTYSVSAGALPSGIGLSSSGALSGRPTQVGTFNFTASVLDSGNIYGQRSTATAPFSITIDPPSLVLSAPTPAGATVATAYSLQLTGAGGVTPYRYTVSAGALPPGLSLNATSGLISGMPTASGTFNFTAQLGDATTGTGAPFSGTRSYSIAVDKAATSLSLPAIAATDIGNTATFTSSVTPAGATGTVSFWPNDVGQPDATISGGSASFTTAALQPGSYTVKARYNGDSNYLPSSTLSTPHTVNRGTAPVSITAPSGEVGPGELIGAQVAQANATGQITFELDGAPQSPAQTLDGTAAASFTLPQLAPGQHSLVAAYGGDSTYVPARSPAVNFVIRRLNTPVAVIAPSGEVSPGDAIDAQTAQADATGQVTFELDGVPQSPAQTLGGDGRASFTLPQLSPGQHSLLADYAGDSTYLPARSTVITFLVRRVNAPATVIAPSGEVSPGDIIDMQMAQADATGQVSFELDGVPQSPAETLDGSARASFTLP
ncbi:MAG: hypothetical protein JWQ65_469, partial [Devosia sp.]|nr:hypothetical protein [Devosia sp.]